MLRPYWTIYGPTIRLWVVFIALITWHGVLSIRYYDSLPVCPPHDERACLMPGANPAMPWGWGW